MHASRNRREDSLDTTGEEGCRCDTQHRDGRQDQCVLDQALPRLVLHRMRRYGADGHRRARSRMSCRLMTTSLPWPRKNTMHML